jgi:hypothetical protein
VAKALCVFRDFGTLGGIEVVNHMAIEGEKLFVAPISAPMLQMVAMPVHQRDSTPGPLYSTMAPAPPLTARMAATLRMSSTRNDQPNILFLRERLTHPLESFIR